MDKALFMKARGKTLACIAMGLLALMIVVTALSSASPAQALSDEKLAAANQVVAQSENADFFAVLHSDGELIFQATEPARTPNDDIEKVYKGSLNGYGSLSAVPWLATASQVTSVRFADDFADLQPLSFRNWFNGCANLESIDLTNLDASKSTTMQKMFRGCSSLAEITNLSSFDTSSSTYFGSMFSGCSSLKSLDVSHFDATHVEVLCFMFNGCSSLETLNMSGDGWRTSQLRLMVHVWEGCTSLKSLDLSYLDTSHVGSMTHDFNGCSSLEYLDLSGADTTGVGNLKNMFDGCSSLATVKLGPKFSFYGSSAERQCALPQGMWKSSVTGEQYAHDAIPFGVGATYTKDVSSDADDVSIGEDAPPTTDAQVGNEPKVGDEPKVGNETKVGDKTKIAGFTYKVTNVEKRTVSLCKVAKGKTKVTIPASVMIGSDHYAITGIARGAFKGTQTKTITIKTKKLTGKTVRGCFKGAKNLKVVKVPKSKTRSYAKAFKKSNSGCKVTIR